MGGAAALARRKIVPAEASKVFSDYAFLFAVPGPFSGLCVSPSTIGRIGRLGAH